MKKLRNIKILLGISLLLSAFLFVLILNRNLKVLGFEKMTSENGDLKYEFTGENGKTSVNLLIKKETTKFYLETITYTEEIRLLDDGSVYMFYSKNSMGDEKCSDYRIIADETNPSSCMQIEEMIKESVESLGFKKELEAMENKVTNLYEK